MKLLGFFGPDITVNFENCCMICLYRMKSDQPPYFMVKGGLRADRVDPPKSTRVATQNCQPFFIKPNAVVIHNTKYGRVHKTSSS
jgi:hypothetical protein